ncbi:MAG: L-tyrosine/L-tryptophan isonitrile synthase family protein [Micromonosporaceae bacterium]
MDSGRWAIGSTSDAVTAPEQTSGAGPLLSHVRSLAAVDLARMRSLAAPPARRVELDREATNRLLSALVAHSWRAVDQLVAEGRRRAAERTPLGFLHHVLTHSRFRRGPRRHFPLAALRDRVGRFVTAGEPVPVALQGFPFKHCDNGLKAAGPLPDLGDLGAVLRLVELQRACTAYYPPGLDVMVMADGGYFRPRAPADLHRYRTALWRLEELAGLGGALRWRIKRDVIAESLGTAAARREEYVRDYQELIDERVRPYAARHDAAAADEPLASVLPERTPRFSGLYRSLLYSVPVPSPNGEVGPEWSRRVLADLPGDGRHVPAAVRLARRAVLRRAWDATVEYLAVLAADLRCRVDQALPPHLRLRSGLTGPGELGLTYLGGSTLLPWHGTGCVDERGQVAVDFRVVLHDRGMVPVHTPSTGPRQPFAMVPSAYVTPDDDLAPELLRRIRLRRR